MMYLDLSILSSFRYAEIGNQVVQKRIWRPPAWMQMSMFLGGSYL
jgi:hypothetical protein